MKITVENKAARFYNPQCTLLPREAAMLAWYWDCNSVYPSICLSVTRVPCDKTKEYTDDILIPRQREFALVFRDKYRLVHDVPI